MYSPVIPYESLAYEATEHAGWKQGSVSARPAIATHPCTCPFKRKIKTPRGWLTLPCGKCLYCAAHKSNDWTTRCYCEMSVSSQTFFTTLTYDDSHREPIAKDTLQRFFKRLRKYGLKFRYIALAEYGPRTLRPHYHILFFLRSDRHFSTPAVFERFLDMVWQNGFVQAKEPKQQHIKYICSYDKRLFISTPTWKLYSLKPGIGTDNEMSARILEEFLETGEYMVSTQYGRLVVPKILRLRAQKEMNLRPPDEMLDFVEFNCTSADISKYLWDLKIAYDSFLKRKL